jgi:hypothetical protein
MMRFYCLKTLYAKRSFRKGLWIDVWKSEDGQRSGILSNDAIALNLIYRSFLYKMHSYDIFNPSKKYEFPLDLVVRRSDGPLRNTDDKSLVDFMVNLVDYMAAPQDRYKELKSMEVFLNLKDYFGTLIRLDKLFIVKVSYTGKTLLLKDLHECLTARTLLHWNSVDDDVEPENFHALLNDAIERVLLEDLMPKKAKEFKFAGSITFKCKSKCHRLCGKKRKRNPSETERVQVGMLSLQNKRIFLGFPQFSGEKSDDSAHVSSEGGMFISHHVYADSDEARIFVSRGDDGKVKDVLIKIIQEDSK